MSERGSFVTQYVYCSRCLKVIKTALEWKSKTITGIQIPTWEDDGPPLPIMAGKLGALDQLGEVEEMRQILTGINDQLCHSVVVVVITDDGYSFKLIAQGKGKSVLIEPAYYFPQPAEQPLTENDLIAMICKEESHD